MEKLISLYIAACGNNALRLAAIGIAIIAGVLGQGGADMVAFAGDDSG